MTLRSLFTSPGTEKKIKAIYITTKNDDDNDETGASIFRIMREI